MIELIDKNDNIYRVEPFTFQLCEIETKNPILYIPEGVDSIGLTAFRHRIQPEIIYFPKSLTKLKADDFNDLFYLKEIYFHPDTKNLELNGELFNNCFHLENIFLPKKIKFINSNIARNVKDGKIIIKPNIYYPGTREELEKIDMLFDSSKIITYDDLSIDDLLTSCGSINGINNLFKKITGKDIEYDER